MCFPPVPICERIASCSCTSGPRPRIGARSSLFSGKCRNVCSIASSIVARRRESDSPLGSSGENAGSTGSVASVLCSSAVTVPRLREPFQEPLGIGWDLVERQCPAVDRVRDEILRNPQGRVQRLALVLIPAVQWRDVAVRAAGQKAQHLQLRIDPRLELAEDLQHELVVKHRARSCSAPCRPAEPPARPRIPEAIRRCGS